MRPCMSTACMPVDSEFSMARRKAVSRVSASCALRRWRSWFQLVSSVHKVSAESRNTLQYRPLVVQLGLLR